MIMANTNDLLDKDQLDEAGQKLAAEILRKDKTGRIKEVKVKITSESKSPRTDGGLDNRKDSQLLNNIGKGNEQARKAKDSNRKQAGGKGGETAEKFNGAPDAKDGRGEKDNGSEASKDFKPQEGRDDWSGDENGSKNEAGANGSADGENQPAGEGEDDDKLKRGGAARAMQEKMFREQAERQGLKYHDSESDADDAVKRLMDDKNNSEGKKSPADSSGQAEKPEEKGSSFRPGGRTDQSDSNLDDRLLNPDQENDAAKKLREDKNGAPASSDKGNKNQGAESGAGGDKPESLRERIRQARQKLDLKEQAKKKLEEKALAPAKRGTSWLLKQAWINLLGSWGLTLIWINIHVFLRWVLGDKLFCKLGEEWLPKQITGAGPTSQATGEKAEEPISKGIGLVEVMGLIILDSIVLAIILAILALIVMIVDFMQASWVEKIAMFAGGLTKLGWAGITALIKLFSGL